MLAARGGAPRRPRGAAGRCRGERWRTLPSIAPNRPPKTPKWRRLEPKRAAERVGLDRADRRAAWQRRSRRKAERAERGPRARCRRPLLQHASVMPRASALRSDLAVYDQGLARGRSGTSRCGSSAPISAHVASRPCDHRRHAAARLTMPQAGCEAVCHCGLTKRSSSGDHVFSAERPAA